ncbi:MAG TPA: hypothetical protein VIQ30_26990 [Pseudonocardia sp.]
MPTSTPAGRLLSIFDQVRVVTREAPFRQVWGLALGYETDSPDEIVNLTELGNLLRQIHHAATTIGESGTGYDRAGLLHGYHMWAAAVYGWHPMYDTSPNTHYTGSSIVSDDLRNTLASTHNHLRAIAREGVFPLEDREDLLSHTRDLIADIISDVSQASDLPDSYRIGMISRLGEIRETIAMVRYRGDQAVAVALQRADLEFSAAVDHESSQPEKAPFRERLIVWSETIRILSNNVTAALAVPGAAIYLLATKDVQAASLILSTATPTTIQTATKTILEWRKAGNLAIEDSSKDGDSESSEA